MGWLADQRRCGRGDRGLVELNLFDDGEPYAGPAVPASGLITAPTDLSSLTASVTDAYEAGDGVVRVTTVDTPTGRG